MGFTTRVASPRTSLRVAQGMGTTRGFTIHRAWGPPMAHRLAHLGQHALSTTTRSHGNCQPSLSALELCQEELGHSLDHNTSLTQESWGMLSSLSYDWHHGVYYPRHIQTSSPKLHSSLGGGEIISIQVSRHTRSFSSVKKKENCHA